MEHSRGSFFLAECSRTCLHGQFAALTSGCNCEDDSSSSIPLRHASNHRSVLVARAAHHHQRVCVHAREVAVTPEVAAVLASDAVVAIGVSGGKDSVACALAVPRHLDAIGHAGLRVTRAFRSRSHRMERQRSGVRTPCGAIRMGTAYSAATSRRHAHQTGKRWASNVEQNRDLSCVRSILPWSTPALRFCISYGDPARVSVRAARWHTGT